MLIICEDAFRAPSMLAIEINTNNCCDVESFSRPVDLSFGFRVRRICLNNAVSRKLVRYRADEKMSFRKCLIRTNIPGIIY